MANVAVVETTEKTQGERVQEIIDTARQYFKHATVLDQINEQVEETLTWMRNNTESFSATGALERGKPWWPETRPVAEVVSEDWKREVLLETRRKQLRDRTYEHGVLHFLMGLAGRGVLSYPDERLVKLVTEATSPALINQLMAHRVAGGSMSLSDLAEFYCYSPGTNNVRVRDKCLPGLCPLGLLSARCDQGYDITIGAVGEAFYKDVYMPILAETEIDPRKGDEQ